MRSRVAWLLVLVACGGEPAAPAVPVHWTYAPPPATFPIGQARGRIGRTQAPQLAARLGIAGEPAAPLRLVTPWAVPGKGPARALLSGLDGERRAVEMIDIDAGTVMWRDEVGCAGLVVGVSDRVVVCTDVHGTRAIGLDGKPRWHNDQTFIAMTDDRVITAAVGEAVVLDAASGDELARVKLPPKVTVDAVRASCGDAGRELYAFGQDAQLARVAEGKGGPQIAWSIAIGSVTAVDACAGGGVLATVNAGDHGNSLVAIARDTGKITGRVDGVLGSWPARDGSDRIEIATVAGVASWPRDLAGAATPLALPVLGELLAKRGELRLVRATPHAAALLDRGGVRAYVPLVEMAAVLGDAHAVAASWNGSPAQTVRRFALPAHYEHHLRVPARHPALAVPAELRDLPPVEPLDDGRAFVREHAAERGVGAIAVDGASVYAIALEEHAAGIARADLASARWQWLRGDGCAGAEASALAVAREVVACAAHDKGHAVVRATGKDGVARWDFATDEVDALAADGDAVLAFAGDHASVLDAGSGRLVAVLASDDGAAMRAVALDVGGVTLVVAYERGHVVARVVRARMTAAWSLAVDGVVRSLAVAGDGVLVELDDGDAFRVDARTGDAVALAGLDLAWHGFADVITGEAAGEPVPPEKMPVPPPVVKKPVPKYEVQENEPPIGVPWTVPPPGPAAWQVTLYELGGGLRARNDYALAAPALAVLARGPAGSPLVAVAGTAAREALVIDVATGNPLRRVGLAEDAHAFATIVDGKPIAGVVRANPLRVVLF